MLTELCLIPRSLLPALMVMMTPEFLLSIVLPAFNEANYIERTLKRIQFALDENRDDTFSWEIIVCDNNSTDRTAELAAQAGANVVFEPINQIARARNTGAGIAKGQWLLFIDADTYPPPELIEDVLEVIHCRRYLGAGTTIEIEGGALFYKLLLEWLNPFYRLLNICGGAFFLCGREAFNAVSGFNMNLYAYEELDFVIRLKRFGRKRGEKFTVLHRHPAITSGRKGEYNFFSMVTLIASNFFAIVLFGLQYILPETVIHKISAGLLGYWYGCRK